MDDRESFKQVLIDAGFSKYEADVYLSVLKLTDASVADISEISPVPRSRIYGVLRDLERQRYLETYEGDSLRARISDPSAVIDDLEEQSKKLSETASGIKEVWEKPKVGRNSVRVFQQYSTTIEEVRSRLSQADTIVHLAVSPDELETLQKELVTLRNRGVIVRITLHGGSRELDDPSKLEIAYSNIVSEVRFCNSLLPLTALIDGNLTIFGVQSKRGNEYGIVVNDHILSSILHWYFQIQLWEPWDTIYSVSNGDEMTYISIRELIRDIESVRESDETVTVRVEGVETFSGDQITITGTVNDIVYMDSTAHNQPFSQPFLQAAIVVSEGSHNYTIGGYGAILEDVRATQVTILSIK